ncbi:MAG: ERCC4 domain-containing protein [Candidatus Micrarchaeia archaeon]
MAKVIVDDRERNIAIIEGLEAKGVQVEFKQLPVGDYIISDRVCIERKTINDFENSLMNGRLFDQIKRLKDHYTFPILLIEGDEEFMLRRNVINGAIAAIYIDYGIVSISSRNAHESADIIESLARHEQKDEHREPSPKGGARAYTEQQFQEFVVGNLPGVGLKLSRALLAHFGSIKNIANASVEQLMEVPKIGKKKAERIHDILNRSFNR